MREVVPQALESVNGSLICKYWERTQRILKAYREGAIFRDADYREKVCKLTLGIDHPAHENFN